VMVTHERPARPYVEIAELRAPASRRNAVIRMSEEAGKLGADALLLGPTVTTGATIVPNYATGQPIGVVADEEITAVAVRWKGAE
jgi:hypothetical protein